MGFKVPSGLVSAPGVQFESDPDSGLYLISDGVIGVAIGGAEVARLSASGVSLDEGSDFLGDYETGSWTPTIESIGGGNPTGVTYSNQAGGYVKIGKLVLARFSVALTSKGTGAGGNPGVGGLPFVQGGGQEHQGLYFASLATNWITMMFQGRGGGNSSGYLVGLQAAAASVTYLAWSDISDTTSITGRLVYESSS